MLSRAPISAPHPGQRDLGRTTDSPFGNRYTATVMKLPTTSPNGRATIARIHASSTGPNPTRVRPAGGGTASPSPAHSWMYEMSCLNPVTPVIPGTSTGL